MEQKEEIARVDRVHRRADEALAQIQAGHLITECKVLFADENNGEEVTWNRQELETWWSKGKDEMIRSLLIHSESAHAIWRDEMAFFGNGPISEVDDMFKLSVQRGHVMYRESALFLIAHPPKDPYAKHRVDERLIERSMEREGFHKSTARK